MRSPQEQEDFLERGRFEDGRSQIRAAFPKSVIIGFAFIVLGLLPMGTAVLFGIGRDDGGPLLTIGFLACLIIGSGCLLWALALKIAKTFRR